MLFRSWATTKRTKCDYALSCHVKPDNTDYLNKLSERWMSAEKVDRTLGESPENITITWKRNITNELIDLTMPDFKGEIFLRLISGDSTKELNDSFTKATSVVFFVNDLDPGTLDGEVPSSVEGTSPGNDAFTVESMSKLTQNILLLKKTKQEIGDCKIIIAISSWDKRRCSPKKSAEDWLKLEHQLFYNVVKNNFSDVIVAGISAQGADYDATDKTLLCDKIENRAYIFTSEKTCDLTILLDSLI